MVDIEKIVCSLLNHERLSFNQYKLTKEMFVDKNYKNYISFLGDNLGKKDISELNQTFLSKSGTSDMFFSLFDLEKLLEVFKIKTIIELLYKQTIKNLIQLKMDKIEGSLNDKNALEEIQEILNEINELIKHLNKEKEKKDPLSSYKDYLSGVVAKQEESNGFTNSIVGITTGLYALDIITKGLKPSEYIILAGRPSMGKTSSALDMVAANIRAGNSALIFSIEMPSEQIIARLLPKLNKKLTLDNTLYGVDFLKHKNEIEATLDIIEKSRLKIEDFSDYSSVTIFDLEKIAMDCLNEFGSIDLVVLDYIQLLSSTLKNSDENAQITDISKRIKGLCKKTQAPWVVLSQLSRSIEQRADKRPLNSDLRSSGSLEQDADLILFPYRPTVYLERELREKISKKPDNNVLLEALDAIKNSEVENAEIIISKNRNGPTGTAPSHFHKKSASYINMGDMDLYGDDKISF